MENKNLALNLEQAFIYEKDLVSRKNQDGTVILMKLDDSSVFYKINGFASILWGFLQKPITIKAIHQIIEQLVKPELKNSFQNEFVHFLNELQKRKLILNTLEPMDVLNKEELLKTLQVNLDTMDVFGQIKDFDLAQIENEVLNNSIYLDVFAGSDLRLKTDINNLKNSLSKVIQLEGVSFKWNEAAKSQSNEAQANLNVGVVAQQVAELMPELVKQDINSGFLAVNYTKMIPYLVESIKELNVILREQQHEIDLLKVALKNKQH